MQSQEAASVESFDTWAVVDVMGHQRFVGKVTEQVVAGHGFVRVDVPETDKQKAWTKLIGPGSIYAITPVSEEIARAMARERMATPISEYDLPEDFKPMQGRLAYVEDDCDSDDPF